jgi:hypothetical protein
MLVCNEWWGQMQDWMSHYCNNMGFFPKAPLVQMHTMINLFSIMMIQKKGQESNCQFDSWPLKVKNFLDLFICRWHATYLWKALDKGYNFALDLTSIRGLHKKNMDFQSHGGPNFKNFEIPHLEVLGQNDIWMLAPWLGTKNTIRGKVVASPKFGLWWVLWICVCSWFIRATKMFQLHTNQLVIWFV